MDPRHSHEEVPRLQEVRFASARWQGQGAYSLQKYRWAGGGRGSRVANWLVLEPQRLRPASSPISQWEIYFPHFGQTLNPGWALPPGVGFAP